MMVVEQGRASSTFGWLKAVACETMQAVPSSSSSVGQALPWGAGGLGLATPGAWLVDRRRRARKRPLWRRLQRRVKRR